MKKNLYLIYIIAGFGAMVIILFYNYSNFNKGVSKEDYSSYIKTTAVVKGLIPQKTVIGKKKRGNVPAIVAFKTSTGRNIEAGANILSLPFLGAVAEKGENVTVFYNPKNPESVITYADKYNISGGYSLFLLGIIVIVISLFAGFSRFLRVKM